LGIISEIDVDVALDHAGVVALEHIICTKGGWEPPGGIGLPQIVLTVHMVHLVGRQRVHGETIQIPYHSSMAIGALARTTGDLGKTLSYGRKNPGAILRRG
jgi:hypothetical protein